MAARSVGSTIVKMTTARRPAMRASASWRSTTVSARGWRTVTNGWLGNWASVAATTRVAVSPVASETTCSSTASASPLTTGLYGESSFAKIVVATSSPLGTPA